MWSCYVESNNSVSGKAWEKTTLTEEQIKSKLGALVLELEETVALNSSAINISWSVCIQPPHLVPIVRLHICTYMYTSR